MTDLVSQLVAQLEDMRGKVIELCQTYGNALPHGSLERTDAALTAAKAGGWRPIETAPKDELIVIYQPKFKRVTTSINDGFDWVHATAWQPLPNPPKGEA